MRKRMQESAWPVLLKHHTAFIRRVSSWWPADENALHGDGTQKSQSSEMAFARGGKSQQGMGDVKGNGRVCGSERDLMEGCTLEEHWINAAFEGCAYERKSTRGRCCFPLPPRARVTLAIINVLVCVIFSLFKCGCTATWQGCVGDSVEKSRGCDYLRWMKYDVICNSVTRRKVSASQPIY